LIMYKYKKLYTLDLSGARDSGEMHEIIRETFDFPDYYGCNWAAFWDCLTNMLGRPINIEIFGLENLERKIEGAANKILSILSDLKHFGQNKYVQSVNVIIVSADNTVSLP